jgi:hypothetical protein
MEDKNVAYLLYKEGVDQTEIAKILGRTEQTICRWKAKERWKEKETEDLMKMQTIHDDTFELVRYQLQTLKELKDQYAKDRENGGPLRLIAKGDIDAIRDLYNMIKDKDVEFTAIVRIVRMLNRFVRDNYPDKAPEQANLLNDFLNEQRKGLQ